MTDNKKPINPWTPEDEREHFPSIFEWWCLIAFFRTIEDNKKWNLKASFHEWQINQYSGSFITLTLIDEDNNKHLHYRAQNNFKKLESAKDILNVMYEDSFLKGEFPNYEMYFNDKKDDIKLNIKYNAEALPHWIAQDAADGWLPIGIDYYRYGFIPKGDFYGTININNKTFTIQGKGYFEHAWGDYVYRRPIPPFKELKKTLGIYTRLIRWHIHNSKPHFNNSIIFTTENNIFGYDWAWALLDNGWMLFYGNIMFWLARGRAAGILIFSKDGKTYEEFADIHFKYNETRYSQSHDFFYPSDFEIIAKKGKEKLNLRFVMTVDPMEFVINYRRSKYWAGIVICEASGTVEGYYFDGEKKIKLSGISKIEPQRRVSRFGHNSLRIDFLKSSKGVGISFDFESHYLRKKLFTKIQLAPYPKIKFNFKKIDIPKRKMQSIKK